jgi:hypothetical protein
MDLDSRLGLQFACSLLRDLGCGVFAVVVDYYYGKFAGIVLLEEAGYCLADRCGFISGGDNGGDFWPRARGFMFCEIVVELAEEPEHASGGR